MNEQILNELRIHSQTVFDNLNIEVSDVLNEHFQKLLISAINRMESDRRTSTSDISEAKLALSKFIREMYLYRDKRVDQRDLIRYQALSESKSSICPLWPIC